MRCDDARVSLSARLDGEAELAATAVVDRHLTGCPACRAWLDGARRVTRAVRVQPVPAEVPDLTVLILAAARADGSFPAPGRLRADAAGRLRSGLRWALGGLAVAQLLLAVPDLLGTIGHDAHAGREVAAFDIALAVGLLVVACYPEHAPVFAPVVFTLVVCFASASALDILQQTVTPARVAVHAVALVQAGIVWQLARSRVALPATP